MIVETGRLILRPFEPRDHAPFIAMNADPEVMRYFDHPLSEAESRTAITRYAARLAEDGVGFLAAEMKSTGEFIGVIGLGRFNAETRDTIPGHPKVEIGWRLRRAMWGKGLAPEGALACLAYAWEEIGLDEVVAITIKDNLPSRRVMEKIGMTHDPDGDFMHPSVPPASPVAAHILYRIKNPGR